jgi:hypothetical protein
MTTIDLRRYAAMIEEAVKAAFIAEKLPIHIHRVVQGPHTMTMVVSLHQPTQSGINKALRMSDALAARVHVSPVRVSTSAGYIFIEVPAPMPALVHGEQLRGDRLTVPLGISPYSPQTQKPAVVGLDFTAVPHLALAGPTNCGKTTTLVHIAYQLANQNRPSDVNFVIIARKPEQWRELAELPHTWKVVVDANEAVSAMRWLCELQDRRNAQPPARASHVFVIVDDVVNLLMVADITAELANLASMGRGAWVHLLLGTQRLARAGAGGAVVISNITNRLVYRVASASDATLYAGIRESGAEQLSSYPGDAVLVCDGSVQRLACAYVQPEAIAALRRGAGRRVACAPWCSTDSTGATGAQTSETAEILALSTGATGATGADTSVEAYVPPLDALPRRTLPHGPLRGADVDYVREVRRRARSLNETLAFIGWGKGPNAIARVRAALAQEQ